jgi:hypothetical protein
VAEFMTHDKATAKVIAHLTPSGGIALETVLIKQVNFTRFSGHLQRLDRDSRQEVDDDETRATRV